MDAYVLFKKHTKDELVAMANAILDNSESFDPITGIMVKKAYAKHTAISWAIRWKQDEEEMNAESKKHR